MDGNISQTQARSGPRQDYQHPPTYRAYHDPDGTAKYSTTLVHALADVTGRDVSDVEAALSDAVEPAALDALFGPSRSQSPGHVAFSVDGIRVTAYSGGQIVITPPARAPDRPRA